MNISDYKELRQSLDNLTEKAPNWAIVLDAKPIIEGDTIRRVPTEQAKNHPEFKERYKNLYKADQLIKKTVTLMDKCVDGWNADIKERADKGLPPTTDIRQLLKAMARFMEATEKPTMGIVGLYDKLRKRCEEWMTIAKDWFPGLTTSTIDKKALATFFNKQFKKKDKATKRSPFDDFYTAFASKANNFKDGDYCRVAVQVYNSDYYTRDENTFAKMVIPFLKACSIEPPKDVAPSHYPITQKTDLTKWL